MKDSSAATTPDLTTAEARELDAKRLEAWMKTAYVRPFTPAEARWHARQFIAHNQKFNDVRLLAEAYLRDTEVAA